MKRIDLIYRNQLRPEIIFCLLFICAMLTIFGLAHVWMGIRKHDKSDELKKTQDRITQLDNEIEQLEIELERMQEAGRIAIRVNEFALDLKKISPTERIVLQEPEITPLAVTTSEKPTK
jgi:hypothetical protein